MKVTLTKEQRDALREAKKRGGRGWKQKVRDAWETGDYRELASADEELGGALQRVRNEVGHAALDADIEEPASDDDKVVKVGDTREGTGTHKVLVRVEGIDEQSGMAEVSLIRSSGRAKPMSLRQLRTAYRLVSRGEPSGGFPADADIIPDPPGGSGA